MSSDGHCGKESFRLAICHDSSSNIERDVSYHVLTDAKKTAICLDTY